MKDREGLNWTTRHSYTLCRAPFERVILSAAKNLFERPFVALRVTRLLCPSSVGCSEKSLPGGLCSLPYFFKCDLDPQGFESLHQALPLPLHLLAVKVIAAQVGIPHAPLQQVIRNP